MAQTNYYRDTQSDHEYLARLLFKIIDFSLYNFFCEYLL
ncbi:MAG: hypothetical protein CSYNP_00240 [Syntrophus sp. SKADARSKE-3]|nr:hypothetical protein [Syntrophus sp. SKADARSKE-3]